MTWVTKTSMPQIGVVCRLQTMVISRGTVQGRPQRVEVTGGITSEKNRLGAQVLDRETTGIKFNRDIIVARESPNRNQIFDQMRRNEDVV